MVKISEAFKNIRFFRERERERERNIICINLRQQRRFRKEQELKIMNALC